MGSTEECIGQEHTLCWKSWCDCGCHHALLDEHNAGKHGDKAVDGCHGCVLDAPERTARVAQLAGVERLYSVGTLGRFDPDRDPDAPDEAIELYVDQLCTRCGHHPCPCCHYFCDTSVLHLRVLKPGDDVDEKHASLLDWSTCGCANITGGCVYAAPPRLFRSDGTLWDGKLR